MMGFHQINASAHDIPTLVDGSVHMIATSPPYFRLRKYRGDQAVQWPAVSYSPLAGLPPVEVPAVDCELGLESSIAAYVGHLILCAREWMRVLRPDGTLWLNLGDSYSGVLPRGHELKDKDLCLIPERVAMALQADGWYLRHKIPWVKRNGMPGSQQDRPTTAHESIFLFSKSERYYYDQHAALIPYAPGSAERALRAVGSGHKNADGAPGQTPHSLSKERPNKSRTFSRRTGSKDAGDIPGQKYAQHRSGREEKPGENPGRYRRDSDWLFESMRYVLNGGQGPLLNEQGDPLALVVNTRGYSGAHFAVWPEPLVEPMIRLSTSDYGCCPDCSAPWRRIVQAPSYPKELRAKPSDDGVKIGYGTGEMNSTGSGQEMQNWRNQNPATTTGWRPSCECCSDSVIPAVVLDPFMGSGTTGKVAVENRRDFVGVDISEDYLDKHDRISGTQIRLF